MTSAGYSPSSYPTARPDIGGRSHASAEPEGGPLAVLAVDPERWGWETA